jgi:hypothetical protein
MSTNQFRRYLDLLKEADLVPPNTNVALPSSGTFSNDDAIANLNRQMAGGNEPRCKVCGTPQSQHQQLQHQFVPGNDIQPAPVAQGGDSSGDISRIKQLQRELSAAGAALGRTGANRDGIDGDLGPLTRAAMIKYPDISAKYADLSADPAAQASTPAVDTSKLTSALDAIETIIKKYKGKTKVSERQVYEAKPKTNRDSNSFTQDELDRMSPYVRNQITGNTSLAPTTPAAAANPNESPEQKRIRLQKSAQAGIDSSRASSTKPPQPPSIYDRFNKPSGAPVGPAKAVELKPSGWTSRIGQKILSKLPGLGARTAAKAGVTAASGPLAPLVGLAATAYTIYDIGSMLYDAYKDSKNLEGMNDADQAVVEQNIAVVNSFMKDPKIANSLPPDIQNRVATVYKDLHELAVNTGYNTPAAAPAATTTPAQTSTPTPAAPTAPAVAPKLKDTMDKLDNLLKKSNFESREPRTLSEQLARDRDIVNEGLGSAAVQHVIKPVAKWGMKTFVKPTATVAGYGAVGYGGYQGYQTWKELTAPTTMDTADQAEFDRLVDEINKLVPNQAAYDALSPGDRKKIDQILDRAMSAKKLAAGTK